MTTRNNSATLRGSPERAHIGRLSGELWQFPTVYSIIVGSLHPRERRC